jgi:CheY-like chemotaxis protein
MVGAERYPKRPRMSETDTSNLTVLVVEDDDDSRYVMRLELEQLGYLVSEADNGMKAVDIALREHPDIILMDLTLPEMDGLEATSRIRADENMRDVPIIAVTAHSESDWREEAKASGFNAYVTKPIDGSWLSELIKGLLV